ncbi:MAG: hypothetical protein VXZ87_03935 [Bacteroidota bacterium]|nr:hypothetical protein [Bacteroidota bacterium]
MRRPKTDNREIIKDYMFYRLPSINSSSPISEHEENMILNLFDRFNEYKTITSIAQDMNISKDRAKTICFKLCLKKCLTFENRYTAPKKFIKSKYGRSFWIFRRAESTTRPIRLVPNTPLFSFPESSRDRLQHTLETLKNDLQRYGLECDTLKIGDTLQIHIKGSNGGLLVAARHMAQRSH